MRKRIFEIIELANEGDRPSDFYDGMMMIAIIVSLIPLAFKTTNEAFHIIDCVTTAIFVVDYILRLVTADYKMGYSGARAFLLYPLTPMALIDLISILPGLSLINDAFRVLKVFRLLRAARVLRAFKFLRYSKGLGLLINVLQKQKRILGAVVTLAFGYILLSALVIYNVEPDSFGNFFDAVYWATVSLTTVGYGDIYPVTTVGRMITMLSSIFGIAIIALPSGVITAGYLSEINGGDEVNEQLDRIPDLDDGEDGK